MNAFPFYSAIVSVFLIGFAWADPTEERTWTSSANTTITGVATSLTDGKVAFETSEGRALTVPLEKLVPEDQKILRKHFAVKLTTLGELVPPDLPYEQGKFHGPISAGEHSSYYLYLPNSLCQDYAAPLIFWTSSVASKTANQIRPFQEAAELTGMILAISVESANANTKGPLTNREHSKICLEHIQETLPVSKERIIFCGRSGGGAEANINADTFPCTGIFIYNSYYPGKSKPKYPDYAFITGGATDYNRYASAKLAKEFKSNGTHYTYPGGHKTDLEKVPTEGICWLHTKDMYDHRDERKVELQHFEARFLKYLQDKLVSEQPHMALYWCDHLLNHCEVDGPLQSVLTEIAADLSPAHQTYVEGRHALNEFSEKYFVSAADGSSKENHTTSRITSAANKLAEKYTGVAGIEETARELAKPTASF